MSNAFNREFDALAMDAFIDASIADVARYTPPGGDTSTPRRVIVNDARQMFAQDNFATAPRTVVGVFLGDGEVAKYGTLAIDTLDGDGNVVSTQTLRLQQLDETDPADDSTQYWVVTHVAP